MQLALDRAEMLQLIDTGTISKGGITITMQESRREAVAAMDWDRAHPDLTDGTHTHRRRWQLAREVETRSASAKCIGLTLTVALILGVSTIAAQCQRPDSVAPTTKAKNAETLQIANTKLAVYQAMPDAQEIAIYDQISRLYVQQQKNSPYATALANFLIPNEANRGEPVGYEVFRRYVEGIVAGKHASEGVTGETAGVYGSIRHVGNIYLEELQEKTEASKP